METRYQAFEDALVQFEVEGRLRHIPDGDTAGLIDLVSNDYMGLSADTDPLPLCFDSLPESIRERYNLYISDGQEEYEWSSSASRLLSTRQRWFSLLEDTLNADYGKPALLFNSGYHANVGVIGALNLPGTLFLVDRLMHASAYDGLFAARARFERFPHNDITKLRRIIEKRLKDEDVHRIVVITEAVFSMDGDRAPLVELSALRNEYPEVLLYVDEAHGFGCFGSRGLGLCEEEGVIGNIDVIIGTFGKAAASMGAFAVAAAPLHDYMVNAARSFIFSTALPPAVIRHSLENYLRLRGAVERRKELAELSAAVRKRIEEEYGPTPSTTHIIPIITGSAETAVALSEKLRSQGFLTLPIRRPTVPPGSERVRISLSAISRLSV